ncbi:MAG: hypothetical protein RIR96_602 [Bacteroidota bacterium]
MKQVKNNKVVISGQTRSSILKYGIQDGYTIVHCHYVSKHKYINGGWVNIFPTTYLFHEGIFLQLEHAENIPVSPAKHYFTQPGIRKSFTLYFPLLPETWDSFDLIEKTNTEKGFVHHNIIRNNSGVYNIEIDY